MLRKFEVKNFKNFRDTISIDFTNVHDYRYNEYCIKNNLINKMIIYGKNSEGKSNLGLALLDVYYDISNRSSILRRQEHYVYKNADSSNNELVEFYYSFDFNGDIVDYRYKKRDISDIVFEELKINGQTIYFYDILSEECDFSNISQINANELNWTEFIDSLKNDSEDIESTQPTALRYIVYNTIQPEESIIAKLSGFIRRMRLTTSVNGRIPYSIYDRYLENDEDLEKFEKFLNDYGIKCKLLLKENIDGRKELFFDYAKPLPFSSNLSSGTLTLTNFYFQFISRGKPSFVYMDEFDAYYHYELSEKIIELLEKEFDCQVILTTHNTNLLSNSIMRPDCFMILSNGKLTPICEATNRELRQGHNLEKLYINGEFDG